MRLWGAMLSSIRLPAPISIRASPSSSNPPTCVQLDKRLPSYPDRTTNRIFNPLVFARVGHFFSIPSRWSAPCFHPSTGRYSYHVPHSALTAYEILLVCPIAALNFEGSKKNTVASTDGKESHGCDRWGMVVQERRSSTESAKARRALG